MGPQIGGDCTYDPSWPEQAYGGPNGAANDLTEQRGLSLPCVTNVLSRGNSAGEPPLFSLPDVVIDKSSLATLLP